MSENIVSERIIEKFYDEQGDIIGLSIQKIKGAMDNLFVAFLESSSLEEISDEQAAEIWSEIWLDICGKALDYEGEDANE